MVPHKHKPRNPRRLSMNLGFVLSLLLILSSLPSLTGAQREEPGARRIVQKIDELYRSTSSRGLMEMEITTPNWTRTLRFRFWSAGTDKTFIRVLSPEKERGMATLRIGNEMWNFLPNIDKIIKIPPSMMMGSWMGSDFTNDDLVKEYTFLADYDFALTELKDSEPGLVYVRCTPHPELPIVWSSVIVAVRKSDELPVWENYYDKGTVVREITFHDVKNFGGREIPSVMELVPATKKGQKTIIRYLEMEFDLAIDPDVFSLRNLRSGM
jgi:outer membrane lipoprotein-sorting protein